MTLEISAASKYVEASKTAELLDAPDWMKSFRAQAWNEFTKIGFPTTQHEEWKYTNVSAIANGDFETSAKVDLTDLESLGSDDAYRLVYVNGRLSKEFSDIDSVNGLIIGNLQSVLASSPDLVRDHLANYATFEDEAFVALNTATFTDGAFLEVSNGKTIEKPVFIVHVTTKNAYAPVRNLIHLGENSAANIAEIYLSVDGGGFTNSVTEVVIERSGRLTHTRAQMEDISAYHVAAQALEQAEHSVYVSQNICLGGAIARTNIYARLGGEHIESTIDGLYCVNGSQHVDNHTAIDHAYPNCNSFELYKGVMDDKSTGVFNGKIFVRQDAQKTDSKQTNQNLLLSEDATINTKPQLEIFADDVRCTHGATVGHLDPNALFYLRARAIGETEARNLLVHAFANEVIQRVKPAGLREELERRLYEKLG